MTLQLRIPGWNVLNATWPEVYEFMQFRVVLPVRNAKSFSMPAQMPFSKLDESQAVITRDFVLSEEMDDQGRSLGVRINGKGYDDPVTEKIKLGTLEKWRFFNTSDDAHPMHLHLVQFQVVERQGFNAAALQKGKVALDWYCRANLTRTKPDGRTLPLSFRATC